MFAGCSGTYLDLTPEMQNVLNNYYKDAEQLRKGVNSAYGILQAEGVYELANLVLGELPSDNTWMKFRQMIMVIMGNWTCSR